MTGAKVKSYGSLSVEFVFRDAWAFAKMLLLLHVPKQLLRVWSGALSEA